MIEMACGLGNVLQCIALYTSTHFIIYFTSIMLLATISWVVCSCACFKGGFLEGKGYDFQLCIFWSIINVIVWFTCTSRAAVGLERRDKEDILDIDSIYWKLPWWLRQQNACNEGDTGSIPGTGRSPEGGSSYPLQYSCLGNPMDRGAWWATVHVVEKGPTRLSD